jgi:hypothetical protein
MDFPVPSARAQQGRGEGCFIMVNGIIEGDSSHGALAANWVHNKVNKALMVFAIKYN